MGLVATTAALVLGLLVASAKAFYDTQNTEVTASSLFEAVAQGLSALRKNEWVEGIEERFGIVKVSVAEVRVEHQVKIAEFTKWLERPGRTPASEDPRDSWDVCVPMMSCFARMFLSFRPEALQLPLGSF